jgi:hypothetical protein
MNVVKRNGKLEPVAFDKITSRIAKLAYGLDERFVDPVRNPVAISQVSRLGPRAPVWDRATRLGT